MLGRLFLTVGLMLVLLASIPARIDAYYVPGTYVSVQGQMYCIFGHLTQLLDSREGLHKQLPPSPFLTFSHPSHTLTQPNEYRVGELLNGEFAHALCPPSFESIRIQGYLVTRGLA